MGDTHGFTHRISPILRTPMYRLPKQRTSGAISPNGSWNAPSLERWTATTRGWLTTKTRKWGLLPGWTVKTPGTTRTRNRTTASSWPCTRPTAVGTCSPRHLGAPMATQLASLSSGTISIERGSRISLVAAVIGLGRDRAGEPSAFRAYQSEIAE